MNKNRKNILTSGVRLEKTLLLLFLCLSLGAQAQKIHIKTGIEVLKSQNFRCLEGKRVGLITNPTGVDNEQATTYPTSATPPPACPSIHSTAKRARPRPRC